jgi:hypothetical protein
MEESQALSTANVEAFCIFGVCRTELICHTTSILIGSSSDLHILFSVLYFFVVTMTGACQLGPFLHQARERFAFEGCWYDESNFLF